MFDAFSLLSSWIFEARGSFDRIQDDFDGSIADKHLPDTPFAIWPSAPCGWHGIQDTFLSFLFPICSSMPVDKLSFHNRIDYSSDEDFCAFAVRNACNKNTLT